MTDLSLTIACSDYDHVRDFASGRVKAEGIDARFLEFAAAWWPPLEARQVLGWTPSVTFKQLVEMMVEADLDELRREQPDRLDRVVGPHGEQVADRHDGDVDPPPARIPAADPLHVGEQRGVPGEVGPHAPDVEQPAGTEFLLHLQDVAVGIGLRIEERIAETAYVLRDASIEKAAARAGSGAGLSILGGGLTSGSRGRAGSGGGSVLGWG